MSKVFIAACLFFSSAWLASGDDTGNFNKMTVITITEPLIVAGVPVVTLEPGKYVLRLQLSSSNRHIVQILNERQDKLYTTVLALSNYRLEPTDKTVISFWETPAGNPRALRAWFFPGDRFGQEFVYPQGLAAKVAREAKATVVETPAQTEAELQTAPLSEVSKTGEEKPFVQEAFAEPVPRPAPVAAAPEPVPEAAPERLPATASPLFGFGLTGMLALIGGVGLRIIGSRL
jgi:hypothetical protein